MLDIDDMVECVKPDERSVMTQVAAYYKAFATSNKVCLGVPRRRGITLLFFSHFGLILIPTPPFP